MANRSATAYGCIFYGFFQDIQPEQAKQKAAVSPASAARL
jgi:hypothetical protein